MPNTFFTSDLHFGHEHVIKYCNRPFSSVEEMNQELISNWNEVVQPIDTVYICGDLALCPYRDFKPIAEQLKGRKILIQGNHDHYKIGQYNKVGIEVFQEVKLKVCGHIVRLSHYPYALPWYKKPFAYKSELRYMERRPPKIKGEFLIHGHTHMKYKMVDNRIHVGVDAWDYKPVPINFIESLLNGYVR